MEEDDDDLYDPADSFPPQQEHNNYNQTTEDTKPGDSYEFEEEEEDDDDDFNIITEAPADAGQNLAHPRHAALAGENQRSVSVDIKPSTPTVPIKAESATPAPIQGRPVATLKPGADYPAIHTSTIDVNGNPIHPVTGKPITSTDLDTDFPSEDDKPWRRPGTDITDFFNYGFDEFTWASYCLKQQQLRNEVSDQKKQLDEMQAFMSMGGIPGMPGAPTPTPAPPTQAAPAAAGMAGMPAMPGMPDMSPDMMQGMLANMMAQGLDPSAMDPMNFMQHMQAMMGGGQPGGGQQNQGYPAQGNQQQMGYGGYNQQGGYGGALRNIKNLVPLLDRVLVQRIKPETKTASGIFLPESTVKEINQATVLAVGPGATDRNGNKIPMSVASGDKVLIPQFGGSPVKVGEEEFTLFRDSEILAKIKE
ncbi:cleavage and polyadenylylation specificity factor [Talaromyces pinophilus]|uniref:Cleavage and polyadenylylation specificity factor n=1 Tax=Talaromyces pinophilus TaxID=128442 RepID=A0A6V8H096_TALPI|nr:cleavage and polyadenylylation specificity factor [Talaromyces pinophilus]